MFCFTSACSSVSTLHTKRVIDHTWLKQRISVLNKPKQNIVCHWLFQLLNMCIKCVFGHTKHVVLACCERVITFIPKITWRVTFVTARLLWSLTLKFWCIVVWCMVNLLARLTNYEILFSKIHNLYNNHLSLILTAMSHRMLNVVCFLDYQWPMRLRSTPPTIFIANRSTIISYSWSMKYMVLGLMEN